MAQFRIDQATPGAGTPGQARHDLVPGEEITLTATSPAGPGVSYSWEILDKVGSTATLSSPTGQTVTLGPAGTIGQPCGFHVRLTVDDNGTVTTVERVFSVRTANLGLRVPLYTETAPRTASLDAHDPDASTDNAVYGDRAGLGSSGQNWRGWAEWAWRLVNAVDTIGAGSAVGPAGGDLGGLYPDPDVLAIRGRTILDVAPADGETLLWNDSSGWWEPGTPSATPAGGAGGDLSGNYPAPTVDGLQGTPVDAAAPSSGDVLTFDGTRWAPTTPSGAPEGPASGDLGGTYPGPEVTGLRGTPVDTATPSSGDVLTFNAGVWAPAPPVDSVTDLQTAYDGGEAVTVAAGVPIVLTTTGVGEVGLRVEDGSNRADLRSDRIEVGRIFANNSSANEEMWFSTWGSNVAGDGFLFDSQFQFSGTAGRQTLARFHMKVNQGVGADGYTGIGLDVTETLASGADNRLLDLKVGGTSQLYVTRDGATAMPDATGVEPAGVAGHGFLYTKDFGGTVHLAYKDSGDVEHQITGAGFVTDLQGAYDGGEDVGIVPGTSIRLITEAASDRALHVITIPPGVSEGPGPVLELYSDRVRNTADLILEADTETYVFDETGTFYPGTDEAQNIGTSGRKWDSAHLRSSHLYDLTAAVPTGSAGKGVLYARDFSGTVHLAYKDSTDTEHRLTGLGFVSDLQGAYDGGAGINLTASTPVSLSTPLPGEDGLTVTDGADTTYVRGDEVLTPQVRIGDGTPGDPTVSLTASTGAFFQFDAATALNATTAIRQTFVQLTPTINQTALALGYTALEVDVAETAVIGTDDRLFDLKVGGVSQAYIDSDGHTHTPRLIATDDGTEAAPSITFASDLTTGLRYVSGDLRLVEQGNDVVTVRYDGGTGQAVLRAHTTGTRSRPTYGWSGRDTSGLFSDGTNNVGLSAAQEAVYLDGSTPAFYPRTASTHQLGTSTLPWSETHTDVLLVDDGAVNAPSIAFRADTMEGFYRSANNTVSYVSSGIERIRFQDQHIRHGDVGALGNVTYGFLDHPGTGMRSDGDGRLFLDANDANVVELDNNPVADGGAVASITGTAGTAATEGVSALLVDLTAPGGDASATLGGYNRLLDVQEAGTTVFAVTASGGATLGAAGTVLASGGSAGQPEYGFIDDPGTGVYQVANDNVGIATSGSLRIGVSNSVLYSNVDLIPSTSGVNSVGSGSNIWDEVWGNSLLAGDGTLGTPGVRFHAEETTGIYRPAADTIAFAANNKAILFDGGGVDDFRPDTDNSYDLGSATHRWREAAVVDVFADTVHVADGVMPTGAVSGEPSITFTNDPTTGLVLLSTERLALAAGKSSLLFYGDANTFLPNGDNIYDLGASGVRWRNVYARDVYAGDLTLHDRSHGPSSPFLVLREGHEELLIFDVQAKKKYRVPLEELPVTDDDLVEMDAAYAKQYGDAV